MDRIILDRRSENYFTGKYSNAPSHDSESKSRSLQGLELKNATFTNWTAVNSISSSNHRLILRLLVSNGLPIFNCGKMALTPQVIQAGKRHQPMKPWLVPWVSHISIQWDKD